MRIANTIAIALVAVAAAVTSSQAWANDAVKVRFSWKLKGEYAFFYLGRDKGIYSSHKVDVELGEGAGAQAALGSLVQGNEDVVIVPAIFAISAIQKGMPVKIAALYQPKTPFAFISHPDRPVTEPKQMEGRSLAVSTGDTATAYLDVLCKKNGIDCSKISKVQIDPQIKVPQFLQNKIDMITVYTNVDLPLIEERSGIKFAVLDLPKYGLSVPGLAAVVSDDGLAKNQDILTRFFSATSEAIDLMRKDPASAASALRSAWSAAPSEELIRQSVVATSLSLQAPEGHINGWIEENVISDAQDLVMSTEDSATRKEPSQYYTNALLQDR
ncbi:ABC-type nitrate/sulfonate/bicarbonate transport system substrate-binding protein [Aminobacter aminovorans]|uniref:ABC-type taurine transport system, periplasmic component n=1 Tax=Aminobacter aminovorans TaxID=83263 RepID=A0A380WPT0_AMIAI|nr:ABC transporter substrate-binding protein [Aminobacter aminovorans]TCS30009.1 ABC-type nitrate/sulfonate/bicarbonate transport system substrate-binding protein [Aminobacter aminovorans]SUU90858.1 ABC-type taurine transport system, periplasmic component [Aminobacter aminovorans]